jgi:autotransporter-associated beta strand protein
MMNGGLVSVSGTLSVPAGRFPGTLDLRSGGTLQIGVGGTTGVLDVSTLTNNGTLIFNRSDASTFSGIISGTGAVTKQGGGTLTLTGTSASPNAIVMDRALNVQAGVLAILESGAGDLYVGNTGTGALNVNGGSVTNLNAYLGGNGSTAFATVSSGTWANSGDIVLGPLGSHSDVTNVELNITGGLVTNVNCAYGLGTFAVTTVSGGTWANSGDLSIAGYVYGRLNVAGGLVTNVNATIGTSGNTVTVSSGTWASSGNLVVNGSLNVTGGLVTNVNATTGGISNVVSVSGGTWASSGNLTVGDTTIRMMNGGLVSVSGTLSVPAGSFPGTLDLRSGGTLQIGVGGTAGVLDVSTLTNNGTLIFNRSDASTFSGIISGAGAVTKQAAGTLTFAGANSYSGLTTISAGTLALSGTGSIGIGGLNLGSTGSPGVFDLLGLTAGAYSLPSSASLAGVGTLSGSGKSLAVLGSLAPGNSAGTITVGTGLSLDLANSGSSVFEITSPAFTPGTFDLVNGDGSVVYGGILNLIFSGGSYTEGTAVLQLFANTGGRSGSFSAVNTTGLAAGQSATFNSATGFITVVPEPTSYVPSAIATAGLASLMRWRKRRTRESTA